MSGGASLMARFRESAAEFLRNVNTYRAAFARFRVERDRDEVGAVRSLQDVLIARRGTLVPSFVLATESPQLAAAVRSDPVCRAVDQTIAKAHPLMTVATRLVDR